MNALREYQWDCLTAICTGYSKGTHRQAVVMSTGLGKTVVAAHLPEIMQGAMPSTKMLFLAHRTELIDQAVAQIRKYNPALNVCKEMAEDYADTDADVVVASVQTLGRKNSSRIGRFDWNDFGIVVCDEAHHSSAQSYRNVFESVGLFSPDNQKLLIGLTATPSRSDGADLSSTYQQVSYSYGLREAIDDGWLVDIRAHRVTTAANLDDVKTSGNDFQEQALADAVDTPQRNKAIVDAWLQLGEDRTTVVFSVNIAHAQHIAKAFQDAGVSATSVWGDDPKRATKLAALRSGRLKVIVNCQVLTEGFDCWKIACVVFARPTKSQIFFTQAAGRGTRLQDGTGNLLEALSNEQDVKRDCLIIDMVDNTKRHKLVTTPTLLGLDADFDLKGESLTKTKKKIEEIQVQHPTVDFSKVKSIADLTLKIESVRLFDYQFSPEVEKFSQYAWYQHGDGYIFVLPDGKSITIEPNLLGHYVCTSDVSGKRTFEEANLEEAFRRCDLHAALVLVKAGKNPQMFERVQERHEEPASDKQIATIAKLYKGKSIPTNLNAGAASRLIGSKVATFTKREFSPKQADFIRKHFYIDPATLSYAQGVQMIQQKTSSWKGRYR
jgi:ATP-dependent helicase IRC3